MAILSPTSLATFVAVCIGLLAIMGWSSRKNHFSVEGKTILVTGGSQGLGLSIAKKLSQRGANVIIIAQNVKKLENAMKAVASCAIHPQSQRFHFISADLRQAKETDRVLLESTAWNDDAPPDSVLLCAGHSLPGYFIDTSAEVHRGQMESIYWVAANMAHSTLKTWFQSSSEKAGSPPSSRHLMFTSTTAAFTTCVGYTPYGPAKAAMRNLFDSLVQEVEYLNASRFHSSGNASTPEVKVHMLFPGGILSPGFEVETPLKPELMAKIEEVDKPKKPDEVAEITLAGLERGDLTITVDFLGHLMKGAAMGTTPGNGWGAVDLMYTGLATLVSRFVSRDIIGQCRAWGKKNGREVKGVTLSPYS